MKPSKSTYGGKLVLESTRQVHPKTHSIKKPSRMIKMGKKPKKVLVHKPKLVIHKKTEKKQIKKKKTLNLRRGAAKK